jgi:tRNA A-37 threonylcarbamoyl transferase component Bud32
MSQTPSGYTEAELAKIQRAIAPAPPPPPPEVVGTLVTPPPEWTQPFWKLVDLEPALFLRLAADPWVEALSQYAFFPEVLQWREQGRAIPQLRMAGRTRGPVAILHSGDDHLAIKPFQNSREDEIARIAASVCAGPRQFRTLEGYLCEQFADGTFFTDLPREGRDTAAMKAVGFQLGGMLRRLHDAGIYYNDATLADPQGRSHLIVAEDGSCTLIDFGVSLLLDRHPEYSREEVHNFARTLPMYRIIAGMAENRSELDDFLREYGRQMAQASREDIMARDLKFAQQGLAIAGQKLGEDVIPPLRDGFLEAYRPPR